ncbi:MAG: hypothetical protein EBT79_01580 [Actinobacteria bacterium]|nr:hypothetical protein [Actinomycetota bacterium]
MRSENNAALASPRSFTVIRRPSVVGAAESEYGLAFHHCPRLRMRSTTNCPASPLIDASAGPDSVTATVSGVSRTVDDTVSGRRTEERIPVQRPSTTSRRT